MINLRGSPAYTSDAGFGTSKCQKVPHELQDSVQVSMLLTGGFDGGLLLLSEDGDLPLTCLNAFNSKSTSRQH